MGKTQDTQLQIGRVIKPHGVRGEVVVEATTDQPELRFVVGHELTGIQAGKSRTLTIAKIRPHQGRLLMTFEEVPDRTQAESLRGVRFFADPIEDPDEESYYDHQLEGLRVLNCGNVDEQTAYARAYEGAQPEPTDIGEVTGVMHSPAGTTLEVTIDEDTELPTAGHTILIPFRHAIVPIVDLDNDALVITPPDGLLELM
ncbi:ribosome maturation factor [Corynebacterium resistens DSM 45100]|uniref:Ribosome maturation factor RimM n=1 Tax=Corynebacterium resistens (strain DSM 45100 / JCM 12819 / GTC 2026 / SICGH 158) TaxID=662755 RepID=F8DYC8_CORRG|nr:ribosome maturation factor RimM [Corynebacterium resistens]AEI09638.1 ribosome maturation factor [Corynebacterium resistens DSM 45100]